MKKILTLAVLSAVTLNVPVLAYSQRGYSEQCFKEVYREEYIPGTRNRPGRVRRWTQTVEVPCLRHRPPHRPYHGPRYQPARPQSNVDDNSCIEGAILGGLAGGAGGAALSRDEGMFIGIPLGIVGGALIGCQLDGG